MGALLEGKWVDSLPPNAKPHGSFSNWIRADGRSEFTAEAGRYHLYVSSTCPYANRAMIMRALKKLDHAITMSVAAPNRNHDFGWEFYDGPGSTEDSVNGARYIHEVYSIARPDYTGPASVPALFDRKTKRMVNNESLEIARMFDLECDAIGDGSVNLYPEELRAEIDRTIAELGFLLGAPFKFNGPEGPAIGAKVRETFSALDRKLASQRFLVDDRITEADVAFYPPIVRYDLVFLERCRAIGLPPMTSFPNLFRWLRELSAKPEFKVVDLDLIARSANTEGSGAALRALLG